MSNPEPSQSLSRRRFLSSSAMGVAGFYVSTGKSRAAEPMVVGHGDFRYEVAAGWGNLDPATTPVANCHEMTEDSRGRLILFQTDKRNNVVVYDKSGKLLETWGTEYGGAHGLEIVNENGEEFLFLTDVQQGKVFKTTLQGRVVMELGRPDLPAYADDKAPYKPTNVIPVSDGTFFVGDGYGSSWVMHYDASGKLLNAFGGNGKKPENLHTPHGGIVDTRKPDEPVLLICSRTDNAVKRFTLAGGYLDTIPIPGMRVCQVALRGDYLVAPHLEGLISVIDKENRVVSNPGGSEPVYDAEGNLATATKSEDSPFVHPHGVWVDEEENIYIAQWNSGKTCPVKLKRV